MPAAPWQLELESVAANKHGVPIKTRRFLLPPDARADEVFQLITPTFAPGYKTLELCAATDRDLVVSLRQMLDSLGEEKPSPFMAPDLPNRTVKLKVQGGAELKEPSIINSAAISQSAYKRGRKQGTGQHSSQGQNPLLTTEATRKMRQASAVLLQYSSKQADGYPYIEYKFQPDWAKDLIVKLVAGNPAGESLARACFKK